MLGGIVDARDEGGSGDGFLRVTLLPWPNARTLGVYLVEGNNIGVREQLNPDDVQDAEEYDVAMALIERMFWERFWEEDLHQHGAAAVRFPCIKVRRARISDAHIAALLGLKDMFDPRANRYRVVFERMNARNRRKSTNISVIRISAGTAWQRRWTIPMNVVTSRNV